MLIPHLHFGGNCAEAISVYEKAFHTTVESMVCNSEYAPDQYADDAEIAHAVMTIHGQTVYLNDRFGSREKSASGAIHLVVWFDSVEELLDCYEVLKDGCTIVDPFEELPYSKLAGNFIDRFGIQWGFMTKG